MKRSVLAPRLIRSGLMLCHAIRGMHLQEA